MCIRDSIKPYLPHADCHPEATGGFSTQNADYALSVDFPPELLSRIDGAQRETVCALLAQALDAQTLRNNALSFAGETWLVRCAQCPGGASASEGDVLAAHRARQEAGLSRCILASTGSFTPAAVRAAEWVDPPVRLIPGPRLAALFGRLHPATDEEIARHARRRRTPFSFARIRALALSPVKLRRYLLCAFLLLLLYLNTGSMLCLASCLLALLLAILCRDESRRSLWL